MIYPLLGTELFPTTDAGQFIIDYRAPVGTRIELTEALTGRMEQAVRQVIPPAELSTIVSNIGLAPGFSAMFSSNAASDSGFMMVALKSDHAHSSFTYIRRLKEALRKQLPGVQTFFSSGSIIDSVLNFGLAAPIDIQLSAPTYSELYPAARRVQSAVNTLAQVANTFIPEESDYPTLKINVDRVRAARLGLNQRDVVTNLVTALTSNAMIAPSIWIEPKTGNDYFLAAQYYENEIDSLETIKNIPVSTPAPTRTRDDTVLLRDVANITSERHPAEADHYNIQRVVDVLVSPRGDDLGGTQDAVQQALKGLKLPAEIKINLRGSVAAMQKSFASFGFGLSMAVVLLYLVMV
ncbi:MAG: efflux RND transporter permease subunit, partial [Candidatus Binataceae bacterium]